MAIDFSGRRVLAVIPHPDDESYTMAGTLAVCALGGAEVKIVCATRGEAGMDRRGIATNSEHLAQIRSVEMARACAVLGVGALQFLNWPDSAVAGLDPDQAVGDLGRILAAFAPDVVVTLGTDGVYGHVDHLAVTRWLSLAVASLVPLKPLRVLHTAFPKQLFASVRRNLERYQHGALLGNVQERDLGCSRLDVDVIVNISMTADTKIHAVQAHASQLENNDPHSFLQRGLIERLIEEEWFKLVSGPPLPDDAKHLFSGLD